MKDIMLLVEPLVPALRRYARGLMADRDAADDLVQDCLENTLRRWHTRRPDGNVRSWVFTILHNLAINNLRQKRSRGWHTPLDEVGEGDLVTPPVQEDRIRHTELMRAVQALPEDQRSVLLLVSVEDLSYAETALALDIPIGTVMSRLSRARERLSRVMNDTAQAGHGPTLRSVK